MFIFQFVFDLMIHLITMYLLKIFLIPFINIGFFLNFTIIIKFIIIFLKIFLSNNYFLKGKNQII